MIISCIGIAALADDSNDGWGDIITNPWADLFTETQETVTDMPGDDETSTEELTKETAEPEETVETTEPEETVETTEPVETEVTTEPVETEVTTEPVETDVTTTQVVTKETRKPAVTTKAPKAKEEPYPAKAVIKKIYKKKYASKKIKMSVKKAKNALGYQVVVFKTKKNARKLVKPIYQKSFLKTKFTLKSKKLKRKKKLYVRVRGFNHTKVGAWSKIKKVKIKKK
jgi:hypothetical protein